MKRADTFSSRIAVKSVLRVENLRTYLFDRGGTVKAVDGVSFDITKGEILGLVGESGCGKTMTALSILGLVPSPPGKVVGGKVYLNGENLLGMSPSKLRALRGNRLSIVFQDPLTFLNPVLRIGEQVAEPLMTHMGLGRGEAWEKAVELLQAVRIPGAKEMARAYPFQFSGGMRQRVMIAMAVACQPDLLIADEPTTALDVTIQAQILDLLMEIQTERGMSVLLITHDLGVIAEMCDRVAVMYAGKIVESTTAETVFDNPKHPYTLGLLNSLPKVGSCKDRLTPIEGQPPNLADLPAGCSFVLRCPQKISDCQREAPELIEIEQGHWVRCIRVR